MDPSRPRSRHVHGFLDFVEKVEPRAFCLESLKALAAALAGAQSGRACSNENGVLDRDAVEKRFGLTRTASELIAPPKVEKSQDRRGRAHPCNTDGLDESTSRPAGVPIPGDA